MTQDEQSNHGVKEAREHRHVLAGLRQVMGFGLNPVTEVKESKDTDVNSTSHTVKDTRGTSSHSEGAVRTTGTSHRADTCAAWLLRPPPSPACGGSDAAVAPGTDTRQRHVEDSGHAEHPEAA